MAITKLPPNTIWLGGPVTVVNDLAASEVITPGHLIEKFNNAGIWRVRKHTGTSLAGSMYATEQSMLNRSVDGDYAASDLVGAVVGAPGATIWAWIASGQNIVFGNDLESAGNGTLKVYSAGVKIATALETQANVTVATRIRVEVL